MTGTQWVIPPVNLPERLALARELHISPVTAQILLNRGITTAAAARAFFQPDPANLIPPEKIPGLPAARERLVQAIEKREKIMVHGDYDVDGLAATAIMLETLARLGVEAEVYIPDRLAEGYGLKKKALIKALELDCRLVVTVDCGITSLEEAIFARQQGLDLIITDHHRPGAELPQARAVVNPLLAPDLPPLCGAGVAFKLAQSLANYFGLAPQGEVAAGWALDLVALATIADAVPLLGENRLLVQLGLKALAGGARPGLKALGEVAGLPAREWTAREVAFGLVPRLNACGRLGSAVPALEILITSSPQRALELAQHLQKENQARRHLEESIAAEAEAMAVKALAAGAKGLVLAAEGWHPGVTGIVAARLVEKFNYPVVLIALAGDRGRGSGRSLPGINLHEILTRCRSHLLAFGGHAQAAGLEIAAKEIPAFQAAFNEAVRSLMTEVQLAPAIAPEAEVLFSQLDWELLAELEGLAPYGEGNPRPLLVYSNARLKAARQVGSNGAHLKLMVGGEGRQLEAIGFNLQLPPGLSPGDLVDLAFYLERDNYQGREELQLALAALRPAGRIPALPVVSKELVAATSQAGANPTWCRQLQAVLNGNRPVAGLLFATSLAIRQCYYGLKRCLKNPVSLRPLGPWLGQAGFNSILSQGRGIITCHPFWPAEAGAGEDSFLVSALVTGEQAAGYLLRPAGSPAIWQVFPELLPLLTELLARGQNVLLYERDAAQMLQLAARLQQELPGVRLAVDTFLDARHLWLARETALSGRLPLLVASREMPAWFYPADAVIFNYPPGSQEEIELALPAAEQVPEVYINLREGDRQPENLRRELVVFYRQLQKGTNNGSRLYIINNKGYHQRWYLAIFEELGLIRVESRGRELAIHLQEVAARCNLMASRRYRQLLAETEMARQFYRQIAGGR
ncbi:single-stranded-DNA-specific exonuclease RecJ [Neomoorella mulderi]|uniref:Single-stranded-DNA-specific exonuclease RecJ n=1 Tax=Moorella mulderi DSM 14980 TaxID=1122241 RepID=A0A151AXH6_9FIRM|nr:single-stranded-DNA-specific exonuclease RecJ [Moorella mulderi]KYH32355.1 single-stranded-DNA-specific exonuclease RecJ [Moorella mulderi DSM 14980]